MNTIENVNVLYDICKSRDVKIIGIGGKKNAGKNYISTKLIELLGDEWIEFSFAEFLKKGLSEFFGFTEDELWGDKKEEINKFWGISGRMAMKCMGTEIMRDNFSNFIEKLFGINLQYNSYDFWVKRFELWFETVNNKNVIVTDVRFKNEIEFIKKKGGITIYVDGSNAINDEHISENSVNENDFDIIFQNYF